MLKIKFWRKESNNLLSHSEGLSEEQIKELQLLKVGDRLIIWDEGEQEGSFATHTLKVYKKKEN
jgi:hypothetical protein